MRRMPRRSLPSIAAMIAIGAILATTPLFAQTTFVYDTFTDINKTALTSHTPDTGSSWTYQYGNGLEVQNNQIEAKSANSWNIYTNATTPGSADYVVGIDITFNSADAFNDVRLYSRSVVTGGTISAAYETVLDGAGNVTIDYITFSGNTYSTTTIATGSTTISAGGTYRLVLEVSGSSISTSVDGTVIASGTDTNLTAAGHAGLGMISSSSGVSANSADNFLASTLAPTEARIVTIDASRNDRGTMVAWRTSMEVDNLGFNVYREEGGRTVRINRGIIAGSALLTANRHALSSGFSYRWIDPGSHPDALYWIEDVSLDGHARRHGPIRPLDEPRVILPTSSSPELSSATSRVARPRAARAPKIEGRPAGTGWTVSSVDGAELTSRKVEWRTRRQWKVAESSAIRIGVDHAGWYRVTGAELIAAGVDPFADPGHLELYCEGHRIPMLVDIGSSGRLDPSDTFEFYGTGLDTPETATRIYWLVETQHRGKRIAVHHDVRGSPASGIDFPSTVTRQDHLVFFAALDNGDQESFFGAIVANTPVDQTLAIRHPDLAPTGIATLQLEMQGVSSDELLDPDHDVAVSLNGHTLGTMTFDGRALGTASFDVPADWLVVGDNVVRLDTGGSTTDVSLVKSIRLTYPHLAHADDDALAFTLDGHRTTTIEGFTSPNVLVVDVTNANNPRIMGSDTIQRQDGTFAATVTAMGHERRSMFVVAPDRIESPISIEYHAPSEWFRKRNRADEIVIAYRDFIPALDPLVELRKSQGLMVAVVDVQDVYDEFSFGEHSAAAIRDFIARTKSWETPPRFALLVGDSSVDPRNYLGTGRIDFVPTKLLFQGLSKTASDAWLADADQDSIEDVALGRLPAESTAESTAMVSRIIRYETTPPDASWSDKVVMVADAPDTQYDFDQDLDAAAAGIPSAFSRDVIRLSADSAGARARLLGDLDDGALVVDFMGHGSVGVWTKGGLLTNGDARALSNGDRAPFVIAMTCLNGFFQDLYTESLAESFLRAPDGGAVAVWASSALTVPLGQGALNDFIVHSLLSGQIETIGEAVRQAKLNGGERDQRTSWILFGDPATRLRIAR